MKTSGAFMLGMLALVLHMHAVAQGLGASAEEMARAYGPPTGLYTVPGTTNTLDVRRITVDGVEYELRVGYELDATAERLHPQTHANTIVLIANRPVPVRQGLAVFPGAAAFCSDTCTVVRLIPGRELLFNQRHKVHSLWAWTMQVYMAETDGSVPLAGPMKNLDSYADVFILNMYHFEAMQPGWGVHGGWDPKAQVKKKP